MPTLLLLSMTDIEIDEIHLCTYIYSLHCEMGKVPAINFNHIDEALSEANIRMLARLYLTYHRKCWCYKQLFKSLKRKDLALHLVSSGLVDFECLCESHRSHCDRVGHGSACTGQEEELSTTGREL